jgi:two-component system, sensor histidine kinase PdtaS
MKDDSVFHGTAPAEEAGAIAGTNGTVPRKILLVEDEKILAMVESDLLNLNGYDVVIAGSGEEAIDVIRADPSLDLVFMDIDLGRGIDGTEAAKEILAIRNIPIVFLTMHSEREMVEKVRGITRYGYVLKSSGEFVLISSIEMAFELFEAHQRLEKKNKELAEANLRLKDSKEIAESYLNVAAEIIISLDAEGNITLLNDSGHRLLGYEKGELVGKNWFATCLPKELRKGIREAFDELMNGELSNIVTYENPVITKSGSRRMILWHNTLFNDKAGRIIGSLSSGEDITERKLAEAKYRALVETTGTGFVILDEEGRVLDANQEYLRLSGYGDLEQIRGRSVIEWTAYYHREKNAIAVAKCAREGIIRNLEIDYVDIDGAVTPIEINATLVQEGGIRRILTLCRNIAARRKAEEELRESATRIADILESISDGFFSMNNEPVVTYFNGTAEQLLGRKKAEVLDHYLFEAFPEARGTIFEVNYTTAVKEKIPISFETYFGTEPYRNWYDVRVLPSKEGISVYFVVTTERKTAEEKNRSAAEGIAL